MKWESFVEQQIREAQDAGAFDNLPGFGKPLHDLGELGDELWWVKRLMKREEMSALPPSLEIKLDVHKTLERINAIDHEALVRRELEQLNQRIQKANYAWGGPPSKTMPLDIEAVVQSWRMRREPGPSDSLS